MRDRLRQRALVSLLKSHDGPPTILASQLFFLFDEKPSLTAITDNMTVEHVVVTVGSILRSKQRLQQEVEAWARDLFKAAGLPFNISNIESISDAPVPGLSVVPSQPATTKTETPSPKRKTRRVYLDLAIKILELGSCTRQGLVDAIMEQFPTLNRETISTFAFDIQNLKYSPIKDRKVVKQADGNLIFEDCVRPALTVIENPNYAGKVDVEPLADASNKKASMSGEDV